MHSIERVCFHLHKMLPEFVWDAGVLEGNPFTFPEVKTLLDGITIGGRKLSDQEQILNLAESSKRLLAMVKSGQFSLSKPVFTELNGIVARNESLEWGVFRGEGQEKNYTPDVGLGEHGRYTPLPTPLRQNSCRLVVITNPGATRMKDGKVRSSIQERGGGEIVAAGERRDWRGVPRGWGFSADT